MAKNRLKVEVKEFLTLQWGFKDYKAGLGVTRGI